MHSSAGPDGGTEPPFMFAVQFVVSIPRYILGKLLGRFFPWIFTSGWSCTYGSLVAPPTLPNEEWVLVRTVYGGICGTDHTVISLRTTTYAEPMCSDKFTFGHENCGVLAKVGAEAGRGAGNSGTLEEGMRVVVEPTLSCVPRGVAADEVCAACREGQNQRCTKFASRDCVLGCPATLIGFSDRTGGSWGAYFTAHRSMVHRVPDAMSDETAVLVEPFCVCLHAVLNNLPSSAEERVVVVGAGVIGLLLVAACRAIGLRNRIVVLSRYAFQTEAARRLGADEVIETRSERELYARVGAATGGTVHRPTIGKQIMVGGAELVFECAGTDSSLDDALRLAGSGGRVVLLGAPGEPRLDWNSIFIQELQLHGSILYAQREHFGGETVSCFALGVRLLMERRADIGWLVTHRFRIEDWREALAELSSKRAGCIKGVFDFRDPQKK